MASMDPEKMRMQDFGGDDKKWLTWKLKFKALLQHHKLAYLLKPGASRPSGVDRVAWDADSENLYAKVVWCTVDTALDLVYQFQDKEDSGVRAWKALEDKYECKDITRMTALHGELFNSALGESQDPDQYFVKIEDIQRQLREMGDEVTNDSLRGIVMSKLPANYTILKPSLRSNKSLDYDTLKSEIQQHYREEIAAKQKIDVDDSNVALPVKFTGQCFGCGKPTHYRVTCFYCKKAGHVKPDCPQLKGNSQKFSLAAVETKVDLTLGQVKQNTWVVDSGCTSHMSESTEGVINFRRRVSEVRVGGGAQLTAIGVGQMEVWARNDAGGMVIITLNDVLIVPGLGYNLLSVNRISSKGGTIYFNRLKNYIELGECTRIPITPVGGLFEVKLRPQRRAVNQALTAADRNWMLWHKRLGHRNHADMKKLSMMNVGVPEGLDPSGKCEVCEVGKHTHRSFPRKTKRRSTTPMEVVHTDIYGPVDKDSIGSSTYAVMFTDDATRWRMIYFMNSKSETLTKFKQFAADVSRLLGGLKVKRIHSDNGLEFVSREFKAFCAEEGIKQMTSGNYAPQQNGTAERGWRTIGEMATCLLQNAGLGTDLWAEAMNHAVYITNRVPTATLGGKTPYFALFGREADLSHLRVFGCLAFVQKTKSQQKKVETKAWKGVMVGIDNYNRTCYRIYNPETDKVTKEVHVTFHESVMYAKKEQSNEKEGDKGLHVPRRLGDVETDDIVPAGAPELPEPVGAPQEAEEVAEDLPVEVAEVTQMEETTNSVGVQGEQEAQAMRRSTRARNLTTCQIENCERGSEVHRAHLSVHHALLAALSIGMEPGVEPTTYKEAMESKDSVKWQTAMDEEYQALKKLKTWDLVKAAPEMKILKNRWLFKTKLDSNGKIARYKARLVVKGFAQEAGIDFNETFAPVAKTKTILVVLAIAAMEDWYLFNMDVDTAFLNSPVDEEIYIYQLNLLSDLPTRRILFSINLGVGEPHDSPHRLYN